MDKEKALEVAKKHALAMLKEMAAELIVPELEQVKADILSKKIDPIKDTSIDNELLAKVVDGVVNEIKNRLGAM